MGDLRRDVSKAKRNVLFSFFSAKRNALRPILPRGKFRFRIQGTVIQPSEILIGMTAFNLKRSSVGHFSVQRQLKREFDIEVSVHEFRMVTMGAVGFDLLSWFCFATGQEAGLAVTAVALLGNGPATRILFFD